MKIYNSLTRRKDEVREKRIGMYVCGPTVYDDPHIGHARSAYIFDIIVKYLRFRGFRVIFVRNITDIDDKIINRAKSEKGGGSLKEKSERIADKYLKVYEEDTARLGLAKPDHEPKATRAIPDIIEFIEILMKKGYAYTAGGSVYFDVRKFKDYGKLSGQSPDEMEEGARVSPDKNKKDPLDFALWKASGEGEPSWKSPWGEGRPGWHIECSVMSTKFLGNDFLIHGGGLDLTFPHHENEIAQTEAAGKKSAKYWVHNGLLTIDGQKMSKSLGNFITIRDFEAKYGDLDFLKLLFLSSHYRHPVDYTAEKIGEAAGMKERILIFTENAKDGSPGRPFGFAQGRQAPGPSVKKEIDNLKDRFIEAMDGDFNTPKALAVIFELVTLGNKSIGRGDIRSALEVKKLLSEICGCLGLSLKRGAVDPEFEKKVKPLIEARNAARGNKDFKKADEIREKLLKEGIVLEDTREGTVWRRRL